MRASLAVALREYNGRAIRWKVRSTTFTKSNRSVIMPAVPVTFCHSHLKNLVCALLAAPLLGAAAEDAALQKIADVNRSAGSFDASTAERFAKLALACVRKEYPDKISHVLNSDADVAPPRKLTPAFLRVLRLALVGARTLAAGAVIAHVSRGVIRKSRARRFEREPHR
jgi:hypothetical protein